jgi:hypothetical protein
MKNKMKIEMEIWRCIILFFTSFIGIWTIIYKLFEVIL